METNTLQVHAKRPRSRSSSRLRKKSQRRFSMPSRDDILGGIDSTPSYHHYMDLQPRKLINEFIKGRSYYNNSDGISLFDEFSGDEDFIDDESDSSSETSSESKSAEAKSSSESTKSDTSVTQPTRRTYPCRKKSRKQSSSESDDDELARPSRTSRQRVLADGSSDTEASCESSPVKRKKRKKAVAIQSDEDDSLPSTLNGRKPLSNNHGETKNTNMINKRQKNKGTVQSNAFHYNYDINKENVSPNPNSPRKSSSELEVMWASKAVHTPIKIDREKPEESSDSEGESDNTFIAISSSCDSSSGAITSSACDTNMALVGNYRQKKRKVKQNQLRKKTRIRVPSDSDSSSPSGLH